VRERLAAGDRWHDEGFVFATTDGRAMDWRALDRAFVRAQERAGVRRQRFHDMRHAFATLLLGAGEEIAVISKMLGHADYSTTVDVYSYLSTERSKVAAARIDVLLKRRGEVAVQAELRSELRSRAPAGQPSGALSRSGYGRGGGIRTHDHQSPRLVRYQTAPRPDRPRSLARATASAGRRLPVETTTEWP
jgi:hypothetical protein